MSLRQKKINLWLRQKTEHFSSRSHNIFRHIGWSLVFKAGSVLCSFMLVPLSIKYLGTEDYGVWLTVSSVLVWFTLFDIGLGNGLRNKFAQARALGRHEEARAYVSTAYFTLSGIGIFLVLLLWSLNWILDWTQIFNTASNKRDELTVLLGLVFGLFGLQLAAKLIISIYQGDLHHSIADKTQFIGQATTLLCLLGLTHIEKPSLIYFGALSALVPVLVLLSLNVIAFTGMYSRYRPRWRYFQKNHLGDIAGLGLRFFIIQAAAIVLFSTDNLIISQLYGPEEVVPYNIAFKYFSIATLAYGILMNPFWSSFTDAYAKNDYQWIKSSVSNVQKIWFLVPFGLLAMILFSDWFYRVWVGDGIEIPISLSVAMAVFVCMQTFCHVYVQFINGIGAIKIQFISALVEIILNVPISIYLAKVIGLGPLGVILGTCICMCISVILRPLQYHKIISGNAKGVWID